MTDPDQRLFTPTLSARDLGWLITGLEESSSFKINKEVRDLAVFLVKLLDGTPKNPAYFWLGEGAERISL